MKKEKQPERKNNRLTGYDYSFPGAYAITICVKDNKQILSKIAVESPGDSNTVGDDVLGVPNSKPKIILTEYGKTADKYINRLNDFYENIRVEKYVIMPNHIHLLIWVLCDDEINKSGTPRTSSPTNNTVAECEIYTDLTPKIYPTNAVAFAGTKKTPQEICGFSGTKNRTSSPTKKQTDENSVKNYSVISNFVSTFKRFCHREIGEKIFQRSYYDHVIRDDKDMIGAETYIDENPAKWLVREEI